MPDKIRVAIICGGRSTEHEVSLASAKNIAEALDPTRFEYTLLRIGKQGQWEALPNTAALTNSFAPLLQDGTASTAHGVDTASDLAGISPSVLSTFEDENARRKIDVVFPIVHGAFGEDGCLQGLLRLLNIPFVGAGVLGSAISMDKDVMKRLLIHAGIPVTKHLTYRASQQGTITLAAVQAELGDFPYFVKPANAGSSVGVSKVSAPGELAPAVAEAFRFDNKILIEAGVDGRELECAVLGNDDPVASDVAEIVPKAGFYSYEAKYLNDTDAELSIPAKLPAGVREEIQRLAVEAFQVLCCSGLARVDFFLDKHGNVIINEINTLPGFTNISMYPQLWAHAGLPYGDLVAKLIDLAIDQHKQADRLQFEVTMAAKEA